MTRRRNQAIPRLEALEERCTPTAGALDPTFDGDGKVFFDFSTFGNDPIRDIAIGADGRIVVAGNADSDAGLVRFLANGAVDTSFGVSGKVRIPIANSGGVHVFADGTILLGGTINGKLALARFLEDGSLDDTFGVAGLAISTFTGTGRELAVAADGKYLLVGETANPLGTAFAVARFNTNGTLDNSFSGDGVFELVGGSTEGKTVLAQPDGLIVAGGTTGQHKGRVIRLLDNGELDESFGNAGQVVINLSSGRAEELLYQPDGKIVVVGGYLNPNNQIFSAAFVARLLTDGSLDSSFDGDGFVTYSVPDSSAGHAGALDSQGRIIFGGQYWTGNPGSFLVARLLPNGAFDPAFGTNGIVTTQMGGSSVAALKIRPSGRIIAAGDDPSVMPLAGYTNYSIAYDVASQFSATNNPNGLWTYGYTTVLGASELTLMTPLVTGVEGLVGWSGHLALNAPAVIYNTTDETIVTPIGNFWLPHEVVYHPGPANEYATVRFTVPEDGIYVIDSANAAQATTDVHVLVNATSLFDALVHPTTSASFVSGPLILSAGDFIDFAVGYGGDNFGNDSTSLYATIYRLDNGSDELPALIVTTLDDELDAVFQANDLSLREAIFLANSTPGAQTITFAASLFAGGPGTITLDQALGTLTISADLTITGPGQTLLTISGNDLVRVFTIDDGDEDHLSDVVIEGVTLAQGRAQDGGAVHNREQLSLNASTVADSVATRYGGGLYTDFGGTLALDNVVVSGNSATLWGGGAFFGGGGVFAGHFTASITGSTFSDNAAGAFGGGLFVDFGARASISTSTLSGNSAQDGAGLYVGGGGEAEVSYANIRDNEASRDGGGIFNSYSGSIANPGTNLVLTYSTVRDNFAARNGGGVFNGDSTAVIGYSTLHGNQSYSGGGLYNDFGGSAKVFNTTISGNLAYHEGGGIFNGIPSALQVINSTITANHADSDSNNMGAGGGIFRFGTTGSVAVRNSIVAGNFERVLAPVANDIRGTGIVGLFNLVGVFTSGHAFAAGSSNNQTGVSAASIIDPDLADNGGPTFTHALLNSAGNLAINAGSNVLAVDDQGSPLLTDQRLFTRIYDGVVDVGAYEAPGRLTLAFERFSFFENAGTQALLATVTRAGDLTDAVTVYLFVDDGTEAAVPLSVVIAAGEATSDPFWISAVDDAITDGPQQVHVSAQAAGYASDQAALIVNDYETAPPAPTPAGPIGSTIDRSPTFAWTGPGVTFDLWVDNLTTGQTQIIRQLVAGTSLASPIDLTVGRSYRWWVRAIDAFGVASAWSAARDFTVTLAGKPTALTPLGSSGPLPAFTWSALAGASAYEVWVNNVTTGQNQVVSEIVTGTSLVSPSALVVGHNYRWWVRGISDEGQIGAWSATASFTAYATGTPVAIGPKGAWLDLPTFSWTDAGADHYDLWVNNLSTGQSQIIRDTNVNGTSYVALLGPGSYRWWVRGVDSNGQAGAWSSSTDFSIGLAAKPAVNAPTGPTTNTVISWNEVGGADHYDVWVNDVTTGQSQVFRDTNVAGTLWSPPELTHGHQYRVWVRAIRGDGGAGAWSDAVNWTASAVLAPVVLGPLGTTVDSRPTLHWDAVANAARYDVWIDNLTTGQTQIYRNQNVAGTSIELPAALGNHNFRWTVRAFDAAGNASGWSALSTFSVQANLTAVLVAPQGGGSGTQPTFVWLPVNGATHYELEVVDLTAGGAVALHVPATTAVEHTAAAPLAPGHNYRFRVRAHTNNGPRNWSAAFTFTVGS